jgi:hypothetical protein
LSNQLAEPGAQPLDPVKDPADRSILIGIVATFAIHLIMVVLAPELGFDKFSGIHTGISVNNQEHGKTFDFELAPAPPEPVPAPSQFVDTNPDAPANEPDKTNNFSNRNQQSAQAVAAKELDAERRPTITDGQDKIKSDTSIVSGELSKPQTGAQAMPEIKNPDQTEQQEQKARMSQSPLSGFDKSEGKSEDGIATNISDSNIPSNNADQKLEGAPDAKDPDGALAAINAAHRAQPKARQRLTAPRTTVLTNRAAGVTNVGVIGRDARWSEYGEYLNELMEIVQVQWYSILEESRVAPPHGSHVIITFKINSKGETDIVKVEDADAGKQGVFSCQNAIQARQPYRKWTDQMIAVLGEEQTLTFAFYYQ